MDGKTGYSGSGYVRRWCVFVACFFVDGIIYGEGLMSVGETRGFEVACG